MVALPRDSAQRVEKVATVAAIIFEAPAAAASWEYKTKKPFWHPWDASPDTSMATFVGVLELLQNIIVGDLPVATECEVLREIKYGRSNGNGAVPHRGLLLSDMSLAGVRADIRARLEPLHGDDGFLALEVDAVIRLLQQEYRAFEPAEKTVSRKGKPRSHAP
ncbi:hypothetical protein M885DRAFT_622934 [Pelagophyceae sp. CCMP2097]|nr:hypothetical protein M885DRAFT_622934 [Pelagophyceae sp. CCMP2097]